MTIAIMLVKRLTEDDCDKNREVFARYNGQVQSS